jgi:hypothetical protein
MTGIELMGIGIFLAAVVGVQIFAAVAVRLATLFNG